MPLPTSAQSISNHARARTAPPTEKRFSLKKISIKNSIEFCEAVPPLQAIILLAAYALIIAVLDHVVGDEYALAFLYVPIICFLTIRVSLNAALYTSIVCAVFWLADDIVFESTANPSAGEVVTAMIHFLCFAVIATFLLRLTQALEKEKQFARYDYLTGLPNMHAFHEQANKLLQGQPPGIVPTSIAFIDCDNFKTVNDTLGHHEGDNLLKVVGQVLKTSTRDSDCTSRYGGDEFIILFSNTDQEIALKRLTQIKQSLDQSMLEHSWPVTFSMGIATFIGPADSIENAIHQADQIMYELKRQSKNGISAQVFDHRGQNNQ